MAADKGDSYKRAISSAFGEMSGNLLLRSASRQPDDRLQGSFPILVHTDRGPVVLRRTDDCSRDFNALLVEGDLPEPPFPTEELFCNPRYTLKPIGDAELTISGTHSTLCVNCGIVSGCEIHHAEAMIRWYEIGGRSHSQ